MDETKCTKCKETIAQEPKLPVPAQLQSERWRQDRYYLAELPSEESLPNVEKHGPDVLEAKDMWRATGDVESLFSLSTETDEKTNGNAESKASISLPSKRYPKLVRNLRHICFNVYRRIFSVIFIANIIAFTLVFAHARRIDNLSLSNIATASSVNLLVAVIIRQDYVVNLIYRVCWIVPHSVPLRIRCWFAKVHELGGVHSGAAVAGTIWYLVFTALITRHFVLSSIRSIPVIIIGYALLLLLVGIVIFAYPALRSKSHNTFEYVHRYAGWTAVALFWAELVLLTEALRAGTSNTFAEVFLRQPSFYLLVLITFNLSWPWLRLRKVQVLPEKLSDHAIRLRFHAKLAPFSGFAISESPLAEWHPFAAFPNQEPGDQGSSMIVSNAGDWTRKTIAEPKKYYWIKGEPKAGVLSMACLFRSCVVVATGSGIGPCLAFLTEPWSNYPTRMLWSTPSPLETYGPSVCDMVHQIDPKARIVDTRKTGRPDLVQLAYDMYMESGAEAIFVISNPNLTRKVVYAMESRGIPAFGPIWDS